MQDIKSFLMENVGFIPFELSGKIVVKDEEAEINLQDIGKDIDETSLKVFFTRLLKREVKISFTNDEGPEFIVRNWQQLIMNHRLKDYLRLLKPEYSQGNKIVFKTYSPIVKNRLTKEKEEVDNILFKHLGDRIPYEIIIDESLKPTFMDEGYDRSDSQDNNLSSDSDISKKLSDIERIVIIGRDFKKVPLPLSMLPSNEGSSVVVNGKIFYKEYNEKGPVSTLFITDKKSSAVVKTFSETANILNKELAEGDNVLIEGSIFYDSFSHEFAIRPMNIVKLKEGIFERKDNYPKKRIELHLHTKLSAMEGLLDVGEVVKTIKNWGHKAVAITDSGVVQSIPEFYEKAVAEGVKPIFGMQAYVVDEFVNIISLLGEDKKISETEFVVFDLETTGLEPAMHEIIEIGAVKIKNMKIVSKFHRLVKPRKPVSNFTSNFTGITNHFLTQWCSLYMTWKAM
ncbi:MAG: PHP domain-containing protein [Thermotogota bacterium]|nr:PHP domain-containing protein [Thermotogota bacterium]